MEAVNDTTKKLAPQGPVQEIGQVVRSRLFQLLASTPADQEVPLSKQVQLSDGFWCLIVEPANFCYIMPDTPDARVRILVPSALQMGWAESPSYFFAATETG